MTHDDDKFEAFLEREAKRYNAPPAEVPRDAMWDAIATARATARASKAAAGDRARIVPQRRPLRYAPWVGMAATLLIGVAIGKYALSTGSGVQAGADSSVASRTAIDTPVVGGNEPGAQLASAPAPQPSAPIGLPIRRTSESVPRSRVVAPNDARARGSNTYDIASERHLTRAEALVAVVAAMPEDATMDSLTARWAKDVLTNTRLLLDSPAGDDPVRRRLLEDLETVLVQLVQRSGRAAEDRELLDRTLKKTQLLTRLRTGVAGT